jgi:hypothetical protein
MTMGNSISPSERIISLVVVRGVARRISSAISGVGELHPMLLQDVSEALLQVANFDESGALEIVDGAPHHLPLLSRLPLVIIAMAASDPDDLVREVEGVPTPRVERAQVRPGIADRAQVAQRPADRGFREQRAVQDPLQLRAVVFELAGVIRSELALDLEREEELRVPARPGP